MPWLAVDSDGPGRSSETLLLWLPLKVAKSGTNGGKMTSTRGGLRACWPSRCADRSGVFPFMVFAGGVLGGVGSAQLGMNVSANVVTDESTAGAYCP